MIPSALPTLPAPQIFGQPSYFPFDLGRAFWSPVPICSPGGSLDFVHLRLLSTAWASCPLRFLGLRVPPGVSWSVNFIHNCTRIF